MNKPIYIKFKSKHNQQYFRNTVTRQNAKWECWMEAEETLPSAEDICVDLSVSSIGLFVGEKLFLHLNVYNFLHVCWTLLYG